MPPSRFALVVVSVLPTTHCTCPSDSGVVRFSVGNVTALDMPTKMELGLARSTIGSRTSPTVIPSGPISLCLVTTNPHFLVGHILGFFVLVGCSPFWGSFFRDLAPPCIGCDMIWLFSVGGTKASGLCVRSGGRTAHLSRPDPQGRGRIRLRATCQHAILRPHLQPGCAASGFLFVVHSCGR